MPGATYFYDSYNAKADGLNLIADPGASGVIHPIFDDGLCYLTLSNSTRLLGKDLGTGVCSAGNVPDGLRVTLYAKSGSGSVEITFSNGFNDAGNNDITFNSTGDWAMFMAVNGSWILIAQSGCTLQTL